MSYPPSYPGQQQPGYPGMPQPSYGFDNNPYPSQQGLGFGGGAPGYPPAGGYPGQQPGYPPQQPGYPSQQPGYPGQQPGYPGSQPGPYPGAPSPYGAPNPYPATQPQPGAYPTQPSAYPQQPSGYPSAQPGAGGVGNLYPSLVGGGAGVAPPLAPPNPGYGGVYGGYGTGAGYNSEIKPGYNPNPSPYNPAGPVPPTPAYNTPAYAPAAYYEGTVKPFQPFNPSDDAQKLKKAMKGFGTDEAGLIDVLCRRTTAQRQQIVLQYKTNFGKDLLKSIRDEISGNFLILMEALVQSPAQLECVELDYAIAGAGTEENTLIDIICTKNNSEMMELKQAYKIYSGRNLESAVGGDVSGYMKRLLVSLITANRSNAGPDHGKAVAQAKELYEGGVKRMGTDEITFNRIFASESFAHLKLVCDEYYKLTGHDIEQAIKREMSGDVERAFLAVVRTARNPPTYYAHRIHETMHGAGTKDRQLIRLIVTRADRDMVQIKQEFQRIYGKSVESFIRGDCSGDYKRGLLALVGDSQWR